MALLAVKLLLAPAFVVGASLAARRFGPRVGGLIAGLPVVAGPILLVYALAHGRAFAAGAAAGTLLGLVSLIAFVVVYARLASRLFWGSEHACRLARVRGGDGGVQRAVAAGGRRARPGGAGAGAGARRASAPRRGPTGARDAAGMGPAGAGGVRARAGAGPDRGGGLARSAAERPAGAVSDHRDGALDVHARPARHRRAAAAAARAGERLRRVRAVLLHAGGVAAPAGHGGCVRARERAGAGDAGGGAAAGAR